MKKVTQMIYNLGRAGDRTWDFVAGRQRSYQLHQPHHLMKKVTQMIYNLGRESNLGPCGWKSEVLQLHQLALRHVNTRETGYRRRLHWPIGLRSASLTDEVVTCNSEQDIA